MQENSSLEYWDKFRENYTSLLKTSYHESRFNAINQLLGTLDENDKILDYGCGEGIYLSQLASEVKFIWGIDLNPGMIDKAKELFKNIQIDSNCYHLETGGVDKIAQIENNSIDKILCLNVLAYMSDIEQEKFFYECKRVLKKDGFMVATFSNKLFDLFTLNSYTYSFFQSEFNVNVESLLTTFNKPNRDSLNSFSRENPLELEDKLLLKGIKVEQIEFCIPHHIPPLLDENHDPDDLINRNVDKCLTRKEYIKNNSSEYWKLYFKCSTFGAKLSFI